MRRWFVVTALAAAVLCLSAASPVAVASDAATQARSSARGGSAVAAVRRAIRDEWLAYYFGPPSRICDGLTRSDQRAFQREFGRAARLRSCLAAAQAEIKALHGRVSFKITPRKWRGIADAEASQSRVKVRGHTAFVVDTIYVHETLVRVHGRWLFSRSFPQPQV